MPGTPSSGAAESFWKGRRVLITGHTGFKGSWLSLWLHEMGAEVSGFSLAPAASPNLFEEADISGVVDSHIGDVRDLALLASVVGRARPELVLHLAAQPLVRRSYWEPVETFSTNVMGTVNVLEAARRHECVRGVVVVTSDKCYENREWEWAYREDEPMGGHDPYSCSKGCSELVVASYRRSYFSAKAASDDGVAGDGALVASVRAGNVIGGGDWSEDRLIPDCVRAIGAGRPIHIRNPHATRPWQHVLEPLDGYLTVARRLLGRDRGAADAFNFGPDEADARPVGEIVSAVVSLWGEGACWTADRAEHPHEASYLKVDSSRARSRLGWRPRLGLREALRWTVEWYRAHAQGHDTRGVTLEQIRRFQGMDSHEHENPMPVLRVA